MTAGMVSGQFFLYGPIQNCELPMVTYIVLARRSIPAGDELEGPTGLEFHKAETFVLMAEDGLTLRQMRLPVSIYAPHLH